MPPIHNIQTKEYESHGAGTSGSTALTARTDQSSTIVPNASDPTGMEAGQKLRQRPYRLKRGAYEDE